MQEKGWVSKFRWVGEMKKGGSEYLLLLLAVRWYAGLDSTIITKKNDNPSTKKLNPIQLAVIFAEPWCKMQCNVNLIWIRQTRKLLLLQLQRLKCIFYIQKWNEMLPCCYIAQKRIERLKSTMTSHTAKLSTNISWNRSALLHTSPRKQSVACFSSKSINGLNKLKRRKANIIAVYNNNRKRRLAFITMCYFTIIEWAIYIIYREKYLRYNCLHLEKDHVWCAFNKSF